MQTVQFTTTPVGANVEVTDKFDVLCGGCSTPCSIDLKRGKEYKATITKHGYEPVEIVLKKGSDGWIWGNILFGGVIGIIIDFSNGSAYRISPGKLDVILNEESVGLAAGESGNNRLLIFDINDLSPEEQTRIRELEPIEI